MLIVICIKSINLVSQKAYSLIDKPIISHNICRLMLDIFFFKIFPGIQRRDISDLGGTGKASWKMWHFDVSVSLMKKDTEGQKDIQTEEEHAGSCDILTSMA